VPTPGLDPLEQEAFNGFVRDERERGKTMFLSSHVLSEVRRIRDRVGILRDGRLVDLDDMETLLHRGGKQVRVQTAGRFHADSLDDVVDVTEFPDGVQFIHTGEYNALLEALSRHDVLEIAISEPPLEDVFLHYYARTDYKPTRTFLTAREVEHLGSHPSE